jgi:hypothetical protein
MINDEQSNFYKEIFMKVIGFYMENLFVNGLISTIVSGLLILILIFMLTKFETLEDILTVLLFLFLSIFLTSFYLLIKSKPILIVKYIKTEVTKEEISKDDAIDQIVNGRVYSEQDDNIYKVFEKEFVLSKNEYKQLEENK